jgi:Excalibur calcium-binding domain
MEGERAAWFLDPDRNVLCLHDALHLSAQLGRIDDRRPVRSTGAAPDGGPYRLRRRRRHRAGLLEGAAFGWYFEQFAPYVGQRDATAAAAAATAAADAKAKAAAEAKAAAAAKAKAAAAAKTKAAADAAAANVYYENCDAVRAAGAAPITAGDPGYSRKVDRDGDGVGCEN